MPFLLKGGKLVTEGGKLVTADDPDDCECCKTPPPPPCDTESGSFDRSLGGCERVEDVATVTNNFAVEAYLTASGNVDDELLIDGNIYQEGKFPFQWEFYGSPCGSTNSSNGNHDWSFKKTLQPGESVKFGGKDNGYGGGVSGSWTLTTCPPPPPGQCPPGQKCEADVNGRLDYCEKNNGVWTAFGGGDCACPAGWEEEVLWEGQPWWEGTEALKVLGCRGRAAGDYETCCGPNRDWSQCEALQALYRASVGLMGISGSSGCVDIARNPLP
jgi:hypothetical protein